MTIPPAYRNLVDRMKAANGLPSPFRSTGGQPVDATDTDDDGGALELMRRTIREMNGDAEPDDDEDGLGAQLGALAKPVRKLMAHQKTLQPTPVVDDKRAKAGAEFVIAVAKAARPHDFRR